MSEDVSTSTGDRSRTQALPGDFHQGMASTPAVDVLLVCPNYSSIALITDAVVYPINLAILAAYLRERSVSVAIIDGRALDYRGNDFRQAIESIRPKIVGITVMSSSVNRAADIARIAKSISPEITVVVGGAHISALPAETLESYSCFDIAVAGEGEQTLYELADTIIHNKYRFDAIGVCSRNGNYRTLSLGGHPQRSELTLFDMLALSPYIIASQIDMFPSQR
jgi:radical SAM superfamily enzyme YgiQ (UPF0313 family)